MSPHVGPCIYAISLFWSGCFACAVIVVVVAGVGVGTCVVVLMCVKIVKSSYRGRYFRLLYGLCSA